MAGPLHRQGLPEGRASSEWLETTAFTASGPTDVRRCPGILGEREGLSGPPAHPGHARAPEVLLWDCGDELPGGGTPALPWRKSGPMLRLRWLICRCPHPRP